jgi:hypothetical protein
MQPVRLVRYILQVLDAIAFYTLGAVIASAIIYVPYCVDVLLLTPSTH